MGKRSHLPVVNRLAAKIFSRRINACCDVPMVDFSRSVEVNNTPQSARPLSNGINVNHLNPGEENWYSYSRAGFDQPDLSWISLALLGMLPLLTADPRQRERYFAEMRRRSEGCAMVFFDPNTGAIIGSDTNIWEYVFNLPTNNSCWWQTNGNIYWLSVQADCVDTNLFRFGWKTCPTNWNDDAVFGDTPDMLSPPPSWYELRRPPYFTNSLDLAFEIITGTNPCPPVVIHCPVDKTDECGAAWSNDVPLVTSICCGTNYTLTLATATNGVCPQVITYSWQVVDCAGSTASCTQSVTVVDTTPPVLTCASNKTVQCGDAWDFDPPTAVDACCGTNVTISIVNTATNGCQATRTWLAKDCCTNSINCSQTVTIIDTTPPAITCPSNILVLTCSTNVAVTWTNTATDNCSSVTITSTPPSGSLFNRDTTNTVTATATDACGNTASCSFQVIVRRPSLSISSGITGGVLRVTITWPAGGVLQSATDLNGIITWTDLPLATSPYTVTPSASRMFYRLRCP